MSAKRILFLISVLLGLALPVYAQAALTVTPITWNVIGIDGNSPTVGPNRFPVGVRVCNTGSSTVDNVTADFAWDDGLDLYTGDPYINLRAGSLSSIDLGSLAPGACADAYYNVEVTQVSGAIGQTRAYHVTATGTDSSSGATVTGYSPQPRQLYVQDFISQGRNGFTDFKVNGTSVAAGGSVNLMAGETYTIEIDGYTATGGYNQLESFLNLSDTVFQVLSVSTTYSSDDSPYVSNPSDKLYADACGWENDPNDPNYNSCVGGDYKAGGTVETIYTIKIIGGVGTSETLSGLFYDFSGSSFHYDSDFATFGVVANIVDPSAITISKTFVPVGTGVTEIILTLNNPTAGDVSGMNFTDPFPAGMVVADPPNATTINCGTPTFSPAAGDTSLSFSDGTIPANSSCVITVDVVTPGTPGNYINTTGDLFIGTTDTGNYGTATLTISDTTLPPPPSSCNDPVTLATWSFENYTASTSLQSGPFDASDAASGITATATYGTGGTGGSSSGIANSTTYPSAWANQSVPPATDNATNSWGISGGWPAHGVVPDGSTEPYFQFDIQGGDNYGGISIVSSYNLQGNWSNGGNWYVLSSTDSTTWSQSASGPWSEANAWQTDAIGASTTNTGQSAYFRIIPTSAQYTGSPSRTDATMYVDDVNITGCPRPDPPTITKSFVPATIGVGGTSTLTFTITNPNTDTAYTLTGLSFTDTFPTSPGAMTVASPLTTTNTCGGTITATAGDTSIVFTGGSLAAGSSCTVTVNVTAATYGTYYNTVWDITTAETGTGIVGAEDTLTVVRPPVISKAFAPNTILYDGTTPGVSTLTFIITNPNQNTTLSGVTFTDTFPTSNMAVATTPNVTTSNCGTPTFSPAAGAGSIAFSGGTIAANSSCTVTVDVAVAATGTYNNTSDPVSATPGGTGNTASASLTVNSAEPAISLLKQVSSSPSGPWLTYLAVSSGDNVYYRFTVENTGNVPLSGINVTDPTLVPTSPNEVSCTWPDPLPVASASPPSDPTATCTTGPVTAVSGSNPNTATAHGTYGSSTVTDSSTATYATTGLTITKSVQQTSYSYSGDPLDYTYVVTNTGSAPLVGPVTVSDDKVDVAGAVTCPDVTTVGDGDNYLDPSESITCTATYRVTDQDLLDGYSVTNKASATVAGVTSPEASVTVDYKAPTVVTLSGLMAFVQDGRVVVQWETASEYNTVGFYLYRYDAGAQQYVKVNKDLLPAFLDSGTGGTYRLIDTSAVPSGKQLYKLVEVQSRGGSLVYGPFTVDLGGNSANDIVEKFSSDGTRVITIKGKSAAVICNAAASSDSGFQQVTGTSSRKANGMSAVTASRLSAARKELSNTKAAEQTRVGSALKIPVPSDGIYYMDASDISTKLGIPLQSVDQMIKTGNLALSNNGRQVSYDPASDNAGLFFFGQGSDSIYSSENIYWLKISSGSLMTNVDESKISLVGPVGDSFSETLHFEENLMPALIFTSDPDSDYWYWKYVVVGNPYFDPRDFSFTANSVSTLPATATITVRFQGINDDTSVSPDHHAIVLLNGTEIGEAEWDGTNPHTMITNVDQSLLKNGGNTLEVKGVLDPGVPYSLFYINSFDVSYARLYESVNDYLRFKAGGSSAITVGGFSTPSISVLDITDPLAPRVVTPASIGGQPGDYSVKLYPDETDAVYVAFTPDAVVEASDFAALPLAGLKNKSNGADYIVIAPEELMDAAQMLADYRQSDTVTTKVVSLESIMDEFSYGMYDPGAIKSFLQYAYDNWRKKPTYAVLVGDGNYDYKNNLGYGGNMVPPLMAGGPLGLFASDTLLGDFTGDDVPEVVVGRIPVDSSEEMAAVLDKIKSFESTVSDEAIMIADKPDGTDNFPEGSDSIAQLLAPLYSVTDIYLSDYSPADAKNLFLEGVNQGSRFVNFTGHGTIASLSAEGFFTSADVAGMSNGVYPMMSVLTCAAGNYAVPGYNSIMELILLKDAGGVAASFAPSGLSYNADALKLGEDFYKAVLQPDVHTVGEAVRQAMAAYHGQGGIPFMLKTFNILGDPALRLKQ